MPTSAFNTPGTGLRSITSALPPGWNALTPAQLGVSPNFWDGNYFTDPASGASAIVLQQGVSYIVAFRGTDGGNDVSSYPELFSGTYINHYQPLLNALHPKRCHIHTSFDRRSAAMKKASLFKHRSTTLN
jgi:hypothetical protein